MPEFTNDWFQNRIPAWEKLWATYVGKPGVRVLEIGSYEGQSALWLLDNVLNGQGSQIHCIDSWSDDAAYLRFVANTGIPAYDGRIAWQRCSSLKYLSTRNESWSYDAIYIDGDHRSLAVMADAALSWPLLKAGGMLLFDDYEWRTDDGTDGPREAIQGFVHMLGNRCSVAMAGAQVALRKERA